MCMFGPIGGEKFIFLAYKNKYISAVKCVSLSISVYFLGGKKYICLQ